MTLIVMNKKEQLFTGIYLAFQLLFLPTILSHLVEFLSLSLNVAQLNFVFFTINFLCTIGICRKFMDSNLRRAVKNPDNLLITVLLTLCFYHFASLAVDSVIFWLMPDFYNVNDISIGAMVTSDFWLTATATVLLVPLTEEILYRGLLFGVLYRRSRIAAYLISTLIFAAIHILGYIQQHTAKQLLLCLLQYIPAGLCLGWAYKRSGTLFAPVLVHSIINAFGIATMR